jgi:hypothetical protein
LVGPGYFLETIQNGQLEFQLIRAECKNQNEANDLMLCECIEILEAPENRSTPAPPAGTRKTKP